MTKRSNGAPLTKLVRKGLPYFPVASPSFMWSPHPLPTYKFHKPQHFPSHEIISERVLLHLYFFYDTEANMPLKDMEVHSRVTNYSVIAKRLWNVLRIAFYMIRRGLISKRKLIMDINLMIKRGKILRKSLSNLMFHHHHSSSKDQYAAAFKINHYEFSCNNSPNMPVLLHLNHHKQRKHHNYFPCINPPHDGHDSEEVVMVPRLDYSPHYSYSFHFSTPDLAPGEVLSPLKQSSPFSVRISNYSSADENDGKNIGQVDDDAEEFIRRFYEQLRTQTRTQLLQ